MYFHVSDTCIMIWPAITLVFAYRYITMPCIIVKLYHNLNFVIYNLIVQSQIQVMLL